MFVVENILGCATKWPVLLERTRSTFHLKWIVLSVLSSSLWAGVTKGWQLLMSMVVGTGEHPDASWSPMVKMVPRLDSNTAQRCGEGGHCNRGRQVVLVVCSNGWRPEKRP